LSLTLARPSDPSPTDMSIFTDKVWALDTRLYKPDPLAE
jgi:hypothetical protein